MDGLSALHLMRTLSVDASFHFTLLQDCALHFLVPEPSTDNVLFFRYETRIVDINKFSAIWAIFSPHNLMMTTFFHEDRSKCSIAPRK